VSRSLSQRQTVILDAIVARLIPSDEHGPGAREARVLRYIERALATEYAADRAAYASGLDAVDEYAAARFGSGFAEVGPERQDAILVDVEQGRASGLAPTSSAFFELVRRHALEGMFGDPSWGGNAGRVGWELLGYGGPRLEWTEEEQQLADV
jgi:gluconate 2-dehydrogenase gamma chain